MKSETNLDKASGKSSVGLRCVRRNAKSRPVKESSQDLLGAHPLLGGFYRAGKWLVSSELLRPLADAGAHPGGAALEQGGSGNDLFAKAREGYTPPTLRFSKGLALRTLWSSSDEGEIPETLLPPSKFLSALLAGEVPPRQAGGGEEGGAQGPVRSDFEVETNFLAQFRVHVLGLTSEGVAFDREVSPELRWSQALAAVKESERAVVDKVAQRQIAAQFDFFEQPRYLDIRSVNSPPPCHAVTNIDFASFPIDEVSELPAGTCGLWIFEDVYQGFAVVDDGRQRYVYSQHPIINLLINYYQLSPRSSAGQEGFEERVIEFSRALSTSPNYRYVHLECSSVADHLERRGKLVACAEQLLEHPQPLYLKSARTSGGTRIVRIGRNEAGGPLLESDSLELGQQLLTELEAHQTRLAARSADLNGTAPVREPVTLREFLVRLLEQMQCPLVEAEIPSVRLAECRVEFRLICQQNARRQMVLTADYVKESANEIAANISLGGRGRDSFEVLHALYCQELDGPEAGMLELARSSLEDLRDRAQKFAQKFHERLVALQPRRPGAWTDFAIDICPVWNAKSGIIEFYLLEVQAPYAYDGLWQVNPEAARTVAKQSEEIAVRVRDKDLRRTFGSLQMFFE